jgi:hypothetical protein
VYVRVPAADTAGWPPAVKSALFEFVTRKVTAWVDSSGGPGVIDPAQPAMVCVPESSRTV